ncbi:MAG: primosomal protein N' [Bacteroidetes bacterium]|jgi:primosomal protein N' (replication factor Y)|nr:primosomal protein N' [Bacteroidota bacterium]
MEQGIDRVWVADVLLPLAVAGHFTYLLPSSCQGQQLSGHRVLVPFGRRQQYAGIVVGCRYLYSQAEAKGLKPVLEVLDPQPVMQDWQLPFIQWLAQYYLCTEGEVLRAALPTGLKVDSQQVLSPTETADLEDPQLSDKAYLLLQALLLAQQLSLEEAAEALGLKRAQRYIAELQAAGYVHQQAEALHRYTEKTLPVLKLTPAYQAEEKLNEAFESLGRAPKQEKILLVVAEAHLRGQLPARHWVLAQAGASAASLAPLVAKGIVTVEALPVSRLREVAHTAYRTPSAPTQAQARALHQIQHSWAQAPTKPILLHGATGSGKTYLYTRLAEDVVAQGRQVLLMLPEIALTKQVVERLRASFGELLGVYHSRYSPAERVEIWNKVWQGEYRVVVGVRSSLWLPFPNLGMILIDEAHDTSLKQQDSLPYFHAGDAALYLAQQLQIPILLGSATPSLEHYRQALAGRYQLVELPEPVRTAPPPQLRCIDMRHEVGHHLSEGRLSSHALHALQQCLQRQEQSVVFVHRRGYAPYLVCTSCGTVPQCPRCDISLSYHKRTQDLRCHYCGFTESQTRVCGTCGQPELRVQDYGTERVAEQLAQLLPGARIARMDADTTRGKNALQELLDRYEQHELDILVGTQMLTKGLDFPRLTLAVVLNADALLSYPDFRAEERAYQLLRQFAGRSGRHHLPGQVLIQTYQPDHPIFGLLTQPYTAFYTRELEARRTFAYPPYTRLLVVELQHSQPPYLQQEAQRLHQLLRPTLGPHLSGPATPAVERLRSRYRRQFMLRLPRTGQAAALKDALRQAIQAYYAAAPDKTLRILLDVDPQ